MTLTHPKRKNTIRKKGVRKRREERQKEREREQGIYTGTQNR